MKKVIALLAVTAFAVALVSCGKKAEEAATTTDTTAAPVETPVVDSTVQDSTATPVDTTATAK